MGLLNFLRGGDWISPTIALAEAVKEGEMGSTIMVDFDTGYSGRDVAAILHRYGIRTYGMSISPVDDAWCFKVHSEDYHRACQIIEREIG